MTGVRRLRSIFRMASIPFGVARFVTGPERHSGVCGQYSLATGGPPAPEPGAVQGGIRLTGEHRLP